MKFIFILFRTKLLTTFFLLPSKRNLPTKRNHPPYTTKFYFLFPTTFLFLPSTTTTFHLSSSSTTTFYLSTTTIFRFYSSTTIFRFTLIIPITTFRL
jgi:hypothetical protein